MVGGGRGTDAGSEKNPEGGMRDWASRKSGGVPEPSPEVGEGPEPGGQRSRGRGQGLGALAGRSGLGVRLPPGKRPGAPGPGVCRGEGGAGVEGPEKRGLLLGGGSPLTRASFPAVPL